MYDLEVIEDLEAAVERACGTDPQALSDAESVQRLHRCLARLEAAVTRAVGAFDAAGSWEADGARTTAMWLVGRCGLSKAAAGRRVRLGRSLRHLPVAEKAWLAGEVGEAQVSALASARTPVTEEALARDEELLVGHATRLRSDVFARVVRYWSHAADPDGAERSAERQFDARAVHLSSGFDGSWVGDMVLDPISGAVVAEALGRIADELFATEWADTKARLGDAMGASKLGRTPAQRRADALVEMARRAGSVGPHGRRPEPLFSVLVGYESFAGRVCELADGTVVAPSSLRPWLDEAWVERVVFESPSRVIDVGARRRLFAGATRRAVEVRDRECFHPLCDERAGRCQVDHVEPWSAGGATVERNGRMACGIHNRGRSRPPPAP